jgi:type IV secretory pathway protease TraF
MQTFLQTRWRFTGDQVDSMDARLIRRASRRRTAYWGRLALPFAVMASSVLAADLAFWCGWRLNLTESEPLGWYLLHPLNVGVSTTPE